MLIYILTIAVTTALAWLYTRTTPSARKLLMVAIVLIPTLVAGLRGVGTDYLLYQKRFAELAAGTYEITDFSLVYVFMLLFNKLGIGYQVLIGLIALVTLSATFFVFSKYADRCNFAVSVFSYMTMFYLMSFNIFRQLLATSLLMLAFYFLFEKKRTILFWVLSVVVFLIHSAVALYSLLFFFIPLIREEKFRKTRIIIYLAICAAILALPMLTPLFTFLAARFPHYAYYFLNFGYASIGSGILRYLILCIMPLACIIWLRGSFSYTPPAKIQPYIVLCVAGSILWLTSYVSTSYLYRIGYVGLAALPLVHGLIFKCMPARNTEQLFFKTMLRCLLVVTLIFFCWFDFVKLNSGMIYPYQFFWQAH